MILRQVIRRFSGAQQPKSLLGVDINSANIKLVELSQNRQGHWMIHACGIAPMESGWVVEGYVKNLAAVVKTLADLHQRTGAIARKVALALPVHAVSVGKLLVPSDMPEQALPAFVQIQAKQLWPDAQGEQVLDFYSLGSTVAPTSLVQNKAQNEIWVASAPKALMLNHREMAQAAGLIPVALDVDAYVAHSMATTHLQRLGLDPLRTNFALFELGTQQSLLRVMHGLELLHEREIDFGSSALTQRLRQTTSIDAEETDALEQRQDDNAAMQRCVRGFVTELAQQLARAMQYFFTNTAHTNIDQIVLTGGGVMQPGVTQAIIEQIGLPCSVLDPFKEMIWSAPKNGAQHEQAHLNPSNNASAFYIACGLAQRRQWI